MDNSYNSIMHVLAKNDEKDICGQNMHHYTCIIIIIYDIKHKVIMHYSGTSLTRTLCSIIRTLSRAPTTTFLYLKCPD